VQARHLAAFTLALGFGAAQGVKDVGHGGSVA
jgi:hypothetical protein